jgi:Tfp pilus assembly protein PilX
MKSKLKSFGSGLHIIKQRGVVLFFALIAMLVMSLAAVALIRSVDTSTLIAGNLAFRQAATTSGDSGIEAAINWLATTDANAIANNIKLLTNPAHPFNVTGGTGAFLNPGYYSNASSAVSLTNGTGIQWNNNDSMLVGTDNSGNTVRYVIQRMCRTANALPSTQELPLAVPPRTDCLFSDALQDNNGQDIPLPQDVCVGAGCPAVGQAPEIRITAQVLGPRFTISYIQAFVY